MLSDFSHTLTSIYKMFEFQVRLAPCLFQSSVEDLLVVSTAQKLLDYYKLTLNHVPTDIVNEINTWTSQRRSSKSWTGRIPDWRWCFLQHISSCFLMLQKQQLLHSIFSTNLWISTTSATEKGPGTTLLLAANTTRRAFQVALLAWARLVVLEAYAPRAVHWPFDGAYRFTRDPFDLAWVCGEDGSNTLEMMTYKTSSVKRTLMLIKHLVYFETRTKQWQEKTLKGIIL